MTHPNVATAGHRLFPYAKWGPRVEELLAQFRNGQPFPHLHLSGFLDPDVAAAMVDEFPGAETEAWTRYNHKNEHKAGLTRRSDFPPLLGRMVDELNSADFVEWLSGVTGIPALLADDLLEAGGLHQCGTGGFLNIHTDFSTHHYHKGWRRRINLIVYLNPNWPEAWGGAIELWDREVQRCVARVPPLLNEVLIFQTDEISYHGFPDPLRCPPGETRKSLALYYYTLDADASGAARSTNYRARPGDGVGKAIMIWLDTQAVALYSRAKTRFGFSDDLASKVLAFLSRKR
jgi:hypothetical protein